MFKIGDVVRWKLRSFNYGMHLCTGTITKLLENNKINVHWKSQNREEFDWLVYSSEIYLVGSEYENTYF